MRASAGALRTAALLLTALLIATSAATGAPRRRTERKPLSPAKPASPIASLVVDVKTGTVLSANQSHRRWPPASTTKILTAILVIERLPMDGVVTISPRAAAQRNGSSIGLEVGEQWLVGDLLSALMVRSANDAAVALAEAVSGSVERFAREMNAQAARLGARDSRFVNPHGLHDPGHYTTAYDLALMARYALRHPIFARLVSTHVWVLTRSDRPQQEYVNSNKLLVRYAGADGVKTGWTAASGPCLVASATREGWQLLAVVLNSQSSQQMYRDVEGLFDQAFQSFRLVRVAERGESLAMVSVGRSDLQIPAIVPADVHAVIKNGAKLTPVIKMRPDLRLPIEAGERVGEVVFLNGQTVVVRSALIAARTVRR